MEIDGHGLEVLDRGECLRLLALTTLGRIGFTTDALPIVLPVSFDLDGERILVRTGRGSSLDAALWNAVVAFEADVFDTDLHSGWSVAVTGEATEIEGSTEVGADLQPAGRWASDRDEATFSISTVLVSGRRTTDGVPRKRRWTRENRYP